MLHLKSDRPEPPGLEAPRPSSLRGPHSRLHPLSEVDRVYGEIFDAAMDRRLLPGAKLTESTLCRIFHCSRSTVRAALSQLAYDKLVVIEPNRGAYVWQASPKEVHDVFVARRALECITIDMLLALPDLRTRLAPLRDMVARERHAYEQGDRVSWIRLSNAFHVELSRLLDNPVLTDMLYGLCARTTLIIALCDPSQDSTCSYEEHEAILEGLARGDRESARTAMDDHLKDCEYRMEGLRDAVFDPWSAFSVMR